MFAFLRLFKKLTKTSYYPKLGYSWSPRVYMKKLKLTGKNQEKVRDFHLLAHAARGMCDRGTLRAR